MMLAPAAQPGIRSSPQQGGGIPRLGKDGPTTRASAALSPSRGAGSRAEREGEDRDAEDDRHVGRTVAAERAVGGDALSASYA